jgi:hypothetical protein
MSQIGTPLGVKYGRFRYRTLAYRAELQGLALPQAFPNQEICRVLRVLVVRDIFPKIHADRVLNASGFPLLM